MNFHRTGSTIVRVSISEQLQEYCKAELLSYAVVRVGGRMLYRIEGELLTAPEAAEKYLGGFDAAYGRSGDEFDAFLAALDAPQGWSE